MELTGETRNERPAVVLVQNPPPVAPLLVAMYCAAPGARFIVDSHSQALLVRRWRWTLPLQRWLARRALSPPPSGPSTT